MYRDKPVQEYFTEGPGPRVCSQRSEIRGKTSRRGNNFRIGLCVVLDTFYPVLKRNAYISYVSYRRNVKRLSRRPLKLTVGRIQESDNRPDTCNHMRPYLCQLQRNSYSVILFRRHKLYNADRSFCHTRGRAYMGKH